MWKWFERIFEDKYIVTISDPDSRSQKIFELRELKKIDNHSIVGRDMKGRKFQFNKVKAFDYSVTKEY